MRFPGHLLSLIASALLLLLPTALLGQSPVRLLADDLTVTLLADDLSGTAMRLDYHAGHDILYIMHRTGEIGTFDLGTNTYEKVADGSSHGISEPSGFGISPDGDCFVVGNDRDDVWTKGYLKRCRINPGSTVPVDWTMVAQTEPYPLSKDFNHLMSGLAVGPYGEWVYINSGSRTDHGEVQDNRGAHPGMREAPITSAILRVPAGGEDIMLRNNADSLQAGGYLFADGVRNHFDMAIGPGGELFGAENSGDRDDSEELNWLREGHHYGFPWRIGTNDTPQQFAEYDPAQDNLINPNSSAARLGLFQNDPGYPPPPEGIEFTDPINNRGPHAAEYRGPDGMYYNAPNFDGVVGTFTPHKSPLGLVFDTAGVLAEPYTGDGFVLGWNQASSDLLGPFEDPGEDLLHLDGLSLDGPSQPYLFAIRIADGFMMPMDAVLIDTSLYVMEMRFATNDARLWRIDFPRKQQPSGVASEPETMIPNPTDLFEAYPNPFSNRLTIDLVSDRSEPVDAALIDVLGRTVWAMHLDFVPAGGTTSHIDADGLAPGPYFLRVNIGQTVSSRVLTLIH